MAIAHGADALGLVARMPSGPGPISDEAIAAIASHIPPGIASFLLSCEQSSAEIISHINRVHTNTLQLVDELSSGTYADIRQAFPHLRIVQVIHVTGEQSITQAKAIQHEVDGILLDSGDPGAKVKTLGGTGNVHNWDISRRICESVNLPVILAGGLKAENVREAIRTVRPYMVDVCSGVRTAGKLDSQKLKAFFEAVSNVQNSG